MRELLDIDDLAQAKVLLQPVRVRLLAMLETPRTCRDLAEALGLSQQRVNHHLKEMLKARLIKIADTQRKKNLLEAVYERSSKAYWLSPELTRSAAEASGVSPERLSLHNLLLMAETLHQDAARLLSRPESGEVHSLGFDAEVTLRDDAERQAFAHDLLRAFHGVAERYQGRGRPGAGGGRFKVLVSCYPQPDED